MKADNEASVHTTEELKRVYKASEIAEILQISVRQAYNLCDGKRFKVKRCGKTGIRIDKKSFDAWYECES